MINPNFVAPPLIKKEHKNGSKTLPAETNKDSFVVPQLPSKLVGKKLERQPDQNDKSSVVDSSNLEQFVQQQEENKQSSQTSSQEGNTTLPITATNQPLLAKNNQLPTYDEIVKRYYKVPAWNPSKPKYPYVLEVIKEGVVIDHIDISKKGFYLMGRLPLCDVTTGSANVSRVHAAVQHTPDGRVLLMDLGSTQGSHLNRKRLYPKKYTFFYTNDVFQMLGSRNFYILQGGPEREEFANLKQQVNDNLSDSSEDEYPEEEVEENENQSYNEILHERKREKSKMDKEYEAFYQDDFKDDYFDRTKVAKKKEKQEIVYTYVMLVEKEADLLQEIDELNKLIAEKSLEINNKAVDEDEDELDKYFNKAQQGLNENEKEKAEEQLAKVKEELEHIRKLKAIAKTSSEKRTDEEILASRRKTHEQEKRQEEKEKQLERTKIENENYAKKLFKQQQQAPQYQQQQQQQIQQLKKDKEKNITQQKNEIKTENKEKFTTNELKEKLRLFEAAAAAEAKEHMGEKRKADNHNDSSKKVKTDEYEEWVPPEGQTGDGKTFLNDIFGY